MILARYFKTGAIYCQLRFNITDFDIALCLEVDMYSSNQTNVLAVGWDASVSRGL